MAAERNSRTPTWQLAESRRPPDPIPGVPNPVCHLLSDKLDWAKTELTRKPPRQEVWAMRWKPAAFMRFSEGGKAFVVRPVCHRKKVNIRASQMRARRRAQPVVG